jgi:hypothetical protein
MTRDAKKNREGKRRYERPELTQVSLRPEEAVLGVCKSASVSAAGHANCTITPKCNSVGS